MKKNKKSLYSKLEAGIFSINNKKKCLIQHDSIGISFEWNDIEKSDIKIEIIHISTEKSLFKYPPDIQSAQPEST